MLRIVVPAVSPAGTTLSVPLFSATKTRPSGAHAAAVGAVSPPAIFRSSKPAGYSVAAAGIAKASANPKPRTAEIRARSITFMSCRLGPRLGGADLDRMITGGI